MNARTGADKGKKHQPREPDDAPRRGKEPDRKEEKRKHPKKDQREKQNEKKKQTRETPPKKHNSYIPVAATAQARASGAKIKRRRQL
jgi:hypothetical protein